MSNHMYEDAPIGTPHANYAPAKMGPFECSRCTHFHGGSGSSDGTCSHPDVMRDAKNGHIQSDAQGHAMVQARGCCTYWRNR